MEFANPYAVVDIPLLELLRNLAIGLGSFWLAQSQNNRWWTLPAGTLVLAALLILVRPDGLYLGFRQGAGDNLIYYGEGPETTVAVFNVPDENFKISFVNGRIEVPTDEISMRIFRLLGHLPPMLNPEAERALMLS